MTGDRFAAVEAALDHAFADRALLERALTHRSWGDGRARTIANERLEFLGDRVLGLLAAERVFADFGEADEGDLAPRLNALVRKETCARAARRMGLGAALRLSKSEAAAGGRDNERILGDACEAVMAALYLDGGLDAARTAFTRFWAEEMDRVGERPKDPKTRLQEWSLARRAVLPDYVVVGREGPDHRPVFSVEVRVPGVPPALGEGGSRRDAERAAATALLAREGGDAPG